MEQTQVQFQSFGDSHVGMRRKNNEDSFLRDDEIGLWVVADGMGGRAAGEVASQQAVETVKDMVISGLGLPTHRSRELTLEAIAECKNIRRVLESAVQAATYMVYGMAEQDQTKSGMGTTLSAALATSDGVIIAQVGDSRIYEVCGDKAWQLTEDHTLVNWQVAQGIISEEEAKTSKQKNVITRAVGNRDYVQVDIIEHKMQPGDRLLLCSDGMHGYISEHEVAPIASQGGAAAVSRFIDLANQRGGKDNITVLLVEALIAY